MFIIRAETPADALGVDSLNDAGFGPDRLQRTVWTLRRGQMAAGLAHVAADPESDRLLATLRFWPVRIGDNTPARASGTAGGLPASARPGDRPRPGGPRASGRARRGLGPLPGFRRAGLLQAFRLRAGRRLRDRGPGSGSGRVGCRFASCRPARLIRCAVPTGWRSAPPGSEPPPNPGGLIDAAASMTAADRPQWDEP